MNRESSLIVNFSEIFGFAETEFGISWNASNDLFFDNAFDYKKCQEWCAEELPEDFESMTREQVLELDDYEKAKVITELFMISEGIQDKTVRIDSQ